MRCSFAAMAALLPWAAVAAPAALAGDPPAAVVADYTRRVQPLLFNRCATGGCHGGPDAGSLHFSRRDFTGRITREITLGNMEAILAACGPERSAATLIATISGRHPTSATSPRELAQPLSTRERAILESWLTTALAADVAGLPTMTASQPANRFRKLLDDAANPPPLPPPQPPQGVILK